MRKITRREFEKLYHNKKPYRTEFDKNLVHNIRLLKLTEGLYIEAKEYPHKAPFRNYFTHVVQREKLTNKFMTRKLGDNSGWIILRIKK